MKSLSGMHDPRGSTCPGPSRFFDCGQELGEGWAPPGFFALDTQDEKDNTDYTIPDRPSPGSARTAPVIAHQGGVKWATDDNNKLRTRSNISIGT